MVSYLVILVLCVRMLIAFLRLFFAVVGLLEGRKTDGGAKEKRSMHALLSQTFFVGAEGGKGKRDT